jgi:hypothetical protein
VTDDAIKVHSPRSSPNHDAGFHLTTKLLPQRVSLSPLVVMLHPTFSNGGAPSLTQCNWYCRTRYGRSFSVNSYRLTSDVDPAPIGLPSQSFPNRFVPRLFALSYPAATPSYLGLSLALYLLRKTSRGKRLIRRAEIPKSLPLFQHSRTPRVNVLQACDVIPSDSPLTPTSSFDLLLWGEDPTSRVTQTLSSFGVTFSLTTHNWVILLTAFSLLRYNCVSSAPHMRR